MTQCKNHTEKQATLQCKNCKGFFCEDCVDTRRFETFTAYVCKVCGGKCEETKDDAKSSPTRVSKKKCVKELFNFWGNILTIFIYPFKGNGVFIIIGGTIVFTLISFMLSTPFGLPLAIVFGFYMMVCAINIVEHSASSDTDGPPDWPSMVHFVDWIGAAFLFIFASAICYGPALAYFLRFAQADKVFYSLLFLGLYMYPMCILLVSLVQRISAFNPFVLIPSVVKTFIPYTFVFILWSIFHSVHYAIGLSPFIDIPFFGPLLKWFFFTYFLIVNMRLLGIFYRGYQDSLGWFDEQPQEAEK